MSMPERNDDSRMSSRRLLSATARASVTATRLFRAESWNLPYGAALLLTIPAFYLSLEPSVSRWPLALYALSGLITATRLGTLLTAAVAAARHHPRGALAASTTGFISDLWLAGGLVGCMALPPSAQSEAALAWRLATALLVLLRLVQLFRHTLTEGGLARMLALATVVLVLCGAGFYWLDPTVGSLEDGIWLAFVTAATVGYGDVVPSTTASRIFSVFVVLLGCGVLSLVTASIAAMFMKSQEQQLERDILHELHRELKLLRAEVRALRQEVQGSERLPDAAPPPDEADSAAKASSPSKIKVSTIS